MMTTTIARKRIRAAVAGAAVVFFVAAAIASQSRPVALAREWIARMGRPLLSAGAYVGGYVRSAAGGDARNEREEDERYLSASAAEIRTLRKENESLRRLLGLKEESAVALQAANVMSYAQIMGRETLFIDRGRDEGIAEGDIVIDEDRLLVGEIMEALPGSSRVSVASNAGRAFSGSLVPLGGDILVKGLGGRALALELIPYDTPIRDGDAVRWMPKGQREGVAIFAGRVVAGTSAPTGAFKTGRAVLLARPDQLERVLVLTRP
ncbi:MAG: rod shape-determining protein MreC [Patescibacteria group bacterium]